MIGLFVRMLGVGIILYMTYQELHSWWLLGFMFLIALDREAQAVLHDRTQLRLNIHNEAMDGIVYALGEVNKYFRKIGK